MKFSNIQLLESHEIVCVLKATRACMVIRKIGKLIDNKVSVDSASTFRKTIRQKIKGTQRIFHSGVYEIRLSVDILRSALNEDILFGV